MTQSYASHAKSILMKMKDELEKCQDYFSTFMSIVYCAECEHCRIDWEDVGLSSFMRHMKIKA